MIITNIINWNIKFDFTSFCFIMRITINVLKIQLMEIPITLTLYS